MSRLGQLTPRLAATEIPTVQGIVWAAGVFEGDGSVSSTGKNKCAHAIVSQRISWLVERLRALFGGSIYRQERAATGYAREESVLYSWNITGARARGFLQSIYGRLSPHRQEQIRRVLQIAEFA